MNVFLNKKKNVFNIYITNADIEPVTDSIVESFKDIIKLIQARMEVAFHLQEIMNMNLKSLAFLLSIFVHLKKKQCMIHLYCEKKFYEAFMDLQVKSFIDSIEVVSL
ncbi:MAG: hypothetical protein H7A25_08835 [Leptospiraceae bacterium]|nr:hypothetical protein [Leptospiraceae bacterium]